MCRDRSEEMWGEATTLRVNALTPSTPKIIYPFYANAQPTIFRPLMLVNDKLGQIGKQLTYKNYPNTNPSRPRVGTKGLIYPVIRLIKRKGMNNKDIHHNPPHFRLLVHNKFPLYEPKLRL